MSDSSLFPKKLTKTTLMMIPLQILKSLFMPICQSIGTISRILLRVKDVSILLEKL